MLSWLYFSTVSKHYFHTRDYKHAKLKYCMLPVADPGPLTLGVLDRVTPTVNTLQTLIAQINFHIYGLGAKSQILSSVAPPRKKKLVTIFSQEHLWGPQKPMFY